MEKTGLLLCGAMMTAAAALLAAQAPAPVAADRGEQVMNAGCLSCHDLRPIQMTALDADGWSAVVAAMIEKGAQVEKPDLPILVEYLAKNHGPLPEGAGKKILLTTCTVCHDLQRVRRTAASREHWGDILGAMLNEGAMLSEEDFPVLLAYVSRNFREQ